MKVFLDFLLARGFLGAGIITPKSVAVRSLMRLGPTESLVVAWSSERSATERKKRALRRLGAL